MSGDDLPSGAPPAPPTEGRRRSGLWSAVAALEVVAAAVAVALDLLVPTLVILALAGVSLAIRREGVRTLGFARAPRIREMAPKVLALVVAWSVLQIGLIMPILNHLLDERQDLSAFEDLQGNVGLLAALLLATWTLAAVGEELAYRGYLPTRIADVVGDHRRAGLVAGIVVSSVLFGLAHTEQGTIGVAVTFLDALFFSAVRLRNRGNLWASVLAHGFNNTIGLIVFFLVGPVYGLW